MSEEQRSSYDDMPYVQVPHSQTHPDRLATLGTLFGMTPPPIDRCRVLELGCAAGGNLISMAANLPMSEFVGVDLSARQITDAESIVGDLELTNIRFRHCDLREIDASWGTFDYIIAHGLFSWVPAEIQQHLFTVCAANLSANGIAYVSYNVYPGWHMLRMARDLMRHQAAKSRSPVEQVQQARALLYFLSRSNPRRDHPYTHFLEHTVTALDKHSDAYVFHEYLEDVNEPLYFHEFLERSSAHGLQYVGEADPTGMTSDDLPADVNHTLTRLSENWMERQQYLDFLHGRQFRESLLCHANVRLDFSERPERVTNLHLASAARSTSEMSSTNMVTAETFHGRHFGSLTTSYPIVKAALHYLAKIWPASISFLDLERVAHAEVYPRGSDHAARALSRETLAQNLSRSYFLIDLLELHVRPSPLVSTVSERPEATRVVRYQAARCTQVTNQRHELFTLTEFERYVLWKLDGNRDRIALVDELRLPAAQAILTQSGVSEARLESTLDTCLERLARHGLLVG